MNIPILIKTQDDVLRYGLASFLSPHDHLTILDDTTPSHAQIAKSQAIILLADTTTSDYRPAQDLAISELITQFPSARLIALCDDVTPAKIAKLFEQGIKGVLAKSSACDHLLTAIKAVWHDDHYTCPPTTRHLVTQLIQHYQTPLNPVELTKRQREVLDHLAQGLATRQIAEQMALSIKTVETHRHHLMIKLKARTTTDLLNIARKDGLISMPY